MPDISIWLVAGAAAVVLALLLLRAAVRTRPARAYASAADALQDLRLDALPLGLQKTLREELEGARQVGVDDVASSFCIVGYARNGDCVGVLTYPDRIHRRYVQEVHSGDRITYTRTLDA